MKVFLMFLSMILTSQVLASHEITHLSYNDDIKVEKVVMNDAILLNDLMKLHSDYDFDALRMIAGKFETGSKKSKKNSYLDELRTKLEGSKNIEKDGIIHYNFFNLDIIIIRQMSDLM
jgi:hypothetical protein